MFIRLTITSLAIAKLFYDEKYDKYLCIFKFLLNALLQTLSLYDNYTMHNYNICWYYMLQTVYKL